MGIFNKSTLILSVIILCLGAVIKYQHSNNQSLTTKLETETQLRLEIEKTLQIEIESTKKLEKQMIILSNNSSLAKTNARTGKDANDIAPETILKALQGIK